MKDSCSTRAPMLRKPSIDAPYAVSVLIGALLGVGLYFLLAPHLRSNITSISPLQPPAEGMSQAAARPDAVRPKVALGEVTRPRVLARATKTTARAAEPVTTPVLRLQRAGERATVETKWIRRRADGVATRQRGASRPQDRAESSARSASRRAKLTPPKPAQSTTLVSIPRLPDRIPPAPPVAQPPVSAPSEAGPRYLVEVGPVPTQERAAEIVRQLAVAGFGGRMSIIHETRTLNYLVISETVPLAVAERRVAVLTQLGFRPELRILAGGFAQLRFGPIASQQEAERLAERVRVTGYAYAAVVQEGGTAYVITTGPYGQDMVDAIQAVLRSRFRWMLPVTVSPVN